MATMIDAERFSQHIDQKTGRAPVVVDLSRSWYGIDADYVLLRDLMENTDVKHLVVSYRTYDGFGYPKFFELGSVPDLISDAFAHREKPVYERVSFALTQLFKKLVDHIGRRAGGRFRKLKHTGPRQAVSGDTITKPNRRKPLTLKAKTTNLADGWRDAPGEWSLDSEKDAHARYYYDKIVALGKDNGVPVTFFYLNTLYSPPLNEVFKKRAEARFGVPIIAMSKAELEQLYPQGLSDWGHSTAFGQEFQRARIRS